MASDASILTTKREDDAMAVLGVGKNMVRSIRYWADAVGIVSPVDEGHEVTQFGVELLLGHQSDKGKYLPPLDPYLEDIQTLGEAACRSGRQPLVVLCLFHQGFNAYSEHLAKSTQKEWDKIAGRFDEIVFHQPLDQIAQLIAAAMRLETKNLPEGIARQARASMDQAIKLGWYGASASRESLRQISGKLFPLDPLVLPVLVRFFRRFGQNERSLFSFLCSYEPFGLRIAA